MSREDAFGITLLALAWALACACVLLTEYVNSMTLQFLLAVHAFWLIAAVFITIVCRMPPDGKWWWSHE